MTIPLFRPAISEAALEAAEAALRSGLWFLGPRTLDLEEGFAAYVGSPHCVAVSSGTAAMHIAVRLAGVEHGDEVVTTALTFVGANHPILYEGATPVFADIDQATGNLDPGSVRSAITDRTKAIIVLHYAGVPCDLDELYAIAAEHDIALIEDCAHACGATYRGRRIGSHGDLHAFSFSPVKNLPTPSGGALTFSSRDHDARARRLRALGVDRGYLERSEGGSYDWDYDVVEVGYRYQMTEADAAIGAVALGELEGRNARRSEIAGLYRERLEGVSGVTLLDQPNDRSSSNAMFCILVEQRDDLMASLGDQDIHTGVHFRRNDTFGPFREADLPNTEWFWQRELSLPMHLDLTDDDIEQVCNVIEKGW